MSIQFHRFEMHDFGIPSPRLIVQNVTLTEGFPIHSHGFHEIVVVTQGDGIQLINGMESELSRGDVFVLKDKDHHGFQPTGAMEIRNILYDPSLLRASEDELAELPGFLHLFYIEPHLRHRQGFRSRIHLDENDLSEIIRRIDSITRILDNTDPAGVLEAGSEFLGLVIRLSRAAGTSSSSGIRPAGPSVLHPLAHVLTMMDTRYNENMPLEDLARNAHMTVRHFFRVFRELRGTTPRKYLVMKRMDKARRLMEQRMDLTVAEVASLCGYDDPNYFTRTFTSTFGESPRAFRRRCRKTVTGNQSLGEPVRSVD